MQEEKRASQPAPSLEVQSWQETAKKVRVDSLATGREFSKSMISLCASGIPVYLALLKLVLPEDSTFDLRGGFLSILPAFIFLVGVVLFAVAFYPPSKGINLDNLTETAGHLSSLMWRRQRLNIAGLVAFVLGNLMGIVVVISHLGTR